MLRWEKLLKRETFTNVWLTNMELNELYFWNEQLHQPHTDDYDLYKDYCNTMMDEFIDAVYELGYNDALPHKKYISRLNEILK